MAHQPGDLPALIVVGVAQQVEHLVVVQDVAGSSPVTHPTRRKGSGSVGRVSLGRAQLVRDR